MRDPWCIMSGDRTHGLQQSPGRDTLLRRARVTSDDFPVLRLVGDEQLESACALHLVTQNVPLSTRSAATGGKLMNKPS